MEKGTMKFVHFMYVPFCGLGNYGGWRGEKWFANRLKIFRQFVVPSLLAQTSKDFTVLISFLPEQKNHKLVKDLKKYLDEVGLKSCFLFNGILFFDDKYPDEIAKERLINSLHYSMSSLYDEIGEAEYVYFTIQPSDDIFDRHAVETLQWMFKHEPQWQAIGFKKGYICNYLTGEVAEYNPLTNPPFATIKFTREQFTNPLEHLKFTSMKRDNGKYKVGTPLPSHEYYEDVFLDRYTAIDERGFLVGVSGFNISTNWNIPYKGEAVSREILKDFGIYDVLPVKLRVPLRKRILFSLPYRWQRKVRYWVTEKFRK